MDAALGPPAEDVSRLRGCLNDLLQSPCSIGCGSKPEELGG
jgi:hypothetical protein